MSDNSKIEWTEATWNPVTGCTKASEGCLNCYITRTPPFRMTGRHFDDPGLGATTGVQIHPERLDIPLHWRKPRRVFVCSLADLFHADVPDRYIGEVFSRMGAARQHTFQVLTKRHARLRSLLRRWSDHRSGGCTCPDDGPCTAPVDVRYGIWPLQNVHVGVSVEDQQRADLRIPALIDTPAAVRWVSAEPLLGPVDLNRTDKDALVDGGIDWVVCGGESGPRARPMHPGWARALRDQCLESNVPFLFKQWGEWAPTGERGIGCLDPRELLVGDPDGQGFREVIRRVGKNAAGRELDGRTWDQYPGAVS